MEGAAPAVPSTALHALPCRGFHLQHLPGCLPWGDTSFLLLPRWGSARSTFICSTQEPSSHPPSAECRGHHSHAQHRAVPSSEPCPMDSHVWYRAMPNIEPCPVQGHAQHRAQWAPAVHAPAALPQGFLTRQKLCASQLLSKLLFRRAVTPLVAPSSSPQCQQPGEMHVVTTSQRQDVGMISPAGIAPSWGGRAASPATRISLAKCYDNSVGSVLSPPHRASSVQGSKPTKGQGRAWGRTLGGCKLFPSFHIRRQCFECQKAQPMKDRSVKLHCITEEK